MCAILTLSQANFYAHYFENYHYYISQERPARWLFKRVLLAWPYSTHTHTH